MIQNPKKQKKSKIVNRKSSMSIPVHCSFQKMVATGDLKPNPENPNTHPAGQVDKLAAIIKAHGWRHPITVSNRSGYIVSGHCRLLAAEKLGLARCPVDYQDFKSKAEERAVLVADNIIGEFSETDAAKMSDIVAELEAADYDLELTAIDAEKLSLILDGPTGQIEDEAETVPQVGRRKPQIEIGPGSREGSRRKDWHFRYKGEIRFGGYYSEGGMTAARAFARKLANLLKDEPQIVEK